MHLTGDITDVTRSPESEPEPEPESLVRDRTMVLEAAADGLCGVNADDGITFANAALGRLLGREQERLEGRSLHDLAHRDDRGQESHSAAVCPYHQRDMSHVTATDPEFHRADDTVIAVDFTLVTDGRPHPQARVIALRLTGPADAAGAMLRRSEQRVRGLSAERDRLVRELAQTEESERLRIAGDIHDDSIQALRAVALELEAAQGDLVDVTTARVALEQAGEQVRAAAARLRYLMFELMPPAPEDDLRTAVDTCCRLLFAAGTIDYEIRGDPGDVPTDTYLLAYRLIQEALRNVVKHAHATRVRIEFGSEDPSMLIRVSDDGVGWDNEHESSPLHAGLSIVRRRAQAAGGSARPRGGLCGRGASIEFRLPVEPSAGG